MAESGMVPEEQDLMMTYLDWYQNTLRPCVKQYVRFTFARYKADKKWEVRSYLSDEEEKQEKDHKALTEYSSEYKSTNLITDEGTSRQDQMLNVANEEYLQKFKLICTQME